MIQNHKNNWNASYTLVLVANALYILIFFIIMLLWA